MVCILVFITALLIYSEGAQIFDTKRNISTDDFQYYWKLEDILVAFIYFDETVV